MEKVQLYSYWKSSCSWRVRTVLLLKKIQHEIQPIELKSSLTEGEQFTQKFRDLNPMGFVPALKIDGLTLIESMNILYYLEETREERPLMPKIPAERAKVRTICDIICSGIQPLQNTGPCHLVGEAKKPEWGKYFIGKGFRAIEELLKKWAGKYCVGNEITLADCCLVPQAYNAVVVFRMDLSEYPTIQRIYEDLLDHPAFKEAHPENQVDCPNKRK